MKEITCKKRKTILPMIFILGKFVKILYDNMIIMLAEKMKVTVDEIGKSIYDNCQILDEIYWL